MQQLINQLLASVKYDKSMIDVLQKQIENVNRMGLDQLRVSTLKNLSDSMIFLENSMKSTRAIIERLTEKLTVEEELSWTTQEN